MQTATVVGLEGEVLTTERNHQIKVQFAWQRNLDAAGNPVNNETGGTRVRVCKAWQTPTGATSSPHA